MPHIITNYSSNLNDLDSLQLLKDVNTVLLDTMLFSEHDIKSRIFKDQNFFYNTAIELTTTLGAVKLMEELKIIEKKIHKNKLFTNGPRRIDLDIIFFNHYYWL